MTVIGTRTICYTYIIPKPLLIILLLSMILSNQAIEIVTHCAIKKLNIFRSIGK